MGNKVSVLTAVYNGAEYLDRCIGSLLSQTHANMQMIFIDDGSTDGSLQKLRSFAKQDKRAEVIALGRNTGAAHARNCGLRRADGDYIMFLDCDDWLAADAVEKAVEAFGADAENDCVLFDMVLRHPETGAEEPFPMPYAAAITGEEAFRASLTWKIHGVYMVRAEIHRRHPYDESCRAYSDDNTTRVHYLCSRKVAFCKGRYYYCQSPKSVTRGVSMLRFEHIKANESMKRQLVELDVGADVIAEYENVRWLALVDAYMLYFTSRRRMSPAERREVLSSMRRVWGGMDARLLRRPLRRKFGYIPCWGCWRLFRLQEEMYFSLKAISGRLPKSK